MLQGMADNGLDIPASLDGAMYNTFAGNQDYVFKGIGDEFAITPSSAGLTIVLGTGKGIICGRSVMEYISEGSSTSIQLPPNSSGYVVIRADLTKTAGNEFYLTTTTEIIAQDINASGTIHDLPLYQYVTGSGTVTNWIDVRKVVAAGNASAAIPYTLLASAWVGNTYTISNTQIKQLNNVFITYQTGDTDEQVYAYFGAGLRYTAQVDGSLTLKALGAVPRIDIPISLLFIG